MPILDVDWNDLELAFRDATGTESYLDSKTGDVMAIVEGFEDERDLRLYLEKEPTRFVRVPPINAEYARAVMRAFISTLPASSTRDRLKSASHGAGALTRCVALLRDDEALLMRYYRFEQSAFWQHLEAFLEDAGVTAADEAPEVDLFEGIG